MDKNKIKLLLMAGVAAPILYFANLLINSLLYPGYSHVTQYVSELGAAEAPYAPLFNTVIILLGALGFAAGFGLFYAVRWLGGNRLLGALTGLLVSLWGIGTALAGMFPMPDERHGGYGLGIGFQLVPLLLALALWRRRSLRGLCVFLLVIFLVTNVFFAIMMGVGQLVRLSNVGLWQRGNALAGIPWLGIACWVLRKELDAET
jgi:glucans biosynthesis protein C